MIIINLLNKMSYFLKIKLDLINILNCMFLTEFPVQMVNIYLNFFLSIQASNHDTYIFIPFKNVR